MPYILSIDQGTTSSRAVLFDSSGQVCSLARIPIKQYYPQPGWVEHNAEELYLSCCQAIRLAMAKVGATPRDLLAIGLANQRETIVVWDRRTGKAIHPALVWQCRRTEAHCEQLRSEQKDADLRKRTGLVLDAYFSATKLSWILDQVPSARRRAQNGELLAGTVDSWILWRLTAGEVHATDVTNASRTMLYNIHTHQWDPELCACFDIPPSILPTIHPNAHHYGWVRDEEFTDADWRNVPITAMAGDQQAALFGQSGLESGVVKATYGTGCFLLMETGTKPVEQVHGLLTTLAWDLGTSEGPHYALEGSVYHAGSIFEWLKDELGVLQSNEEIEELSRVAGELDQLYLVPAFTGLGSPYWDGNMRGMLLGLSRSSNRAHLCRAALEAIAYQVADVYACMLQGDPNHKGASFSPDLDSKSRGQSSNPNRRNHCPSRLPRLRVDGGVSLSPTLLQMQADVLGCSVERPQVIETTAFGIALLAGLQRGLWSREDLATLWRPDTVVEPQWSEEKRARKLAGWHRAVHCAQAMGLQEDR